VTSTATAGPRAKGADHGEGSPSAGVCDCPGGGGTV